MKIIFQKKYHSIDKKTLSYLLIFLKTLTGRGTIFKTIYPAIIS